MSLLALYLHECCYYTANQTSDILHYPINNNLLYATDVCILWEQVSCARTILRGRGDNGGHNNPMRNL